MPSTHEPSGHASPQSPAWKRAIAVVWDFTVHSLSYSPWLDPLRSSLLEQGGSRAAMRLLVAVVLNHMRRILVPYAGQFLFRHALTDMKLARSSPHHFLIDAAAGFTWVQLGAWAAMTAYLVRLRRFLRERALADHWGDGWMVLYLAAALTASEAAYVQTCWTFAQIYAYAILFRGGPDAHAFLGEFLDENPARVTAQLGLVTGWIVVAVVPVLRSGKMALLALHAMVWGVTAYLVRYSNKYFLLLEMSDMFVTLAWMALGVTFVAIEVMFRRVREKSS